MPSLSAEPQTYDDAQSATAVSTANYEDIDDNTLVDYEAMEDVKDYEEVDTSNTATYDEVDATANVNIGGEYGGLVNQALYNAAPKKPKEEKKQKKKKQKQSAPGSGANSGAGGQRPRANTQYENTAASHTAGKPRARASSSADGVRVNAVGLYENSAGAAASTGRRGTDWNQTKPVLNARGSQQAVTAVVQSWDSPANAAVGGAGSRPSAAATKPGINRSARKASVYLGFDGNGEHNDSDDDLDV